MFAEERGNDARGEGGGKARGVAGGDVEVGDKDGRDAGGDEVAEGE